MVLWQPSVESTDRRMLHSLSHHGSRRYCYHHNEETPAHSARITPFNNFPPQHARNQLGFRTLPRISSLTTYQSGRTVHWLFQLVSRLKLEWYGNSARTAFHPLLWGSFSQFTIATAIWRTFYALQPKVRFRVAAKSDTIRISEFRRCATAAQCGLPTTKCNELGARLHGPGDSPYLVAAAQIAKNVEISIFVVSTVYVGI